MFRNKLKKILFCFLLISFYSNLIFAQPVKLQINKWITNWHLLGPIQLEKEANKIGHLLRFENDILTQHGGESNLTVKTWQVEQFGNSTATWTKYTSPASIIDLHEAVSKKSLVAAYAFTEIFVEKEGVYIISVGTDDGGRLWINGKEVWDSTTSRKVVPDDDLIPIFLKQGKNTILLKVENRGGGWGFCVRILPCNIDKIIKNEFSFDVVTLSNGVSELRTSLNSQVAKSIFKSGKLSIYSNDKNSELIWSGEWTKNNKMILELDKQDFKPCILQITIETKDGKKIKNKILFNSGKHIEHILFSNQKTDYKIVVSENASKSEQWAAKELQKYLSKISGADFEITGDENDVTKNEIIVGYNKHSQKLLGDNFKKPDISDESFIYKNIKSNLVMLGGKQRGTMYAVLSFLENVFGIRWYTPKITIIPKREKYSFDYINHSEKPSIQVRNDFYYEAFKPIWAAHNKVNGAMSNRKQIGGVEIYDSVHTFYRYLPPTEFYKKHPEYYSLIDGKRIYERAQLCLSNPDVIDIMTERLKQEMRKNPEALIYSVSQNDWQNPCQCSDCQKIVDKEGSQSGIIIWFVNQVADRIKAEFPDKYVGTLAYTYTRKPPKEIKPKENVIIRFCSIECCFAHDFNSCPKNRDFMSDMHKWSAISPHLYIWDYVVNFSHYIMPYPNFNVLQQNIKIFEKNNAIGIMEQANYQSRGGEFAELRAYVIAKLLWNMNCDVDKVIDDFMYGYYGRSGQYVREYFDLLHAQITPDTHIHFRIKPDDKIFSEKFIREADKIFDKAEIVADNDEIKERVEMARLPLMYLKCKRNPVNSKSDGTYDKFNKIVEREGITHFAEAGIRNVKAFHNAIRNAK